MTARKEQKKQYEGDNLLTVQIAKDAALALEKKTRHDAIIKEAEKMILEAEKLIPTAVVVAEEDDSDVDDDDDKVCVDTATQAKLYSIFVIASSTMTQIATDVPCYNSIAELANKLHVLQIRISKYCISCQWALSFYSSLKNLSTFIDISKDTTLATSAPSRGLPGGDRKKARAHRDDVSSYAEGSRNATQIVLNSYTSWAKRGDRLCTKIDERRDVFREQNPATKSIPTPTLPHYFEDPDQKTKRRKLMEDLTDQLSTLCYQDYCAQMGGVTPHSTLLGICIGADGTFKEHTNGFECQPGLLKCLKSQMGHQATIKQKKKAYHGKHTLYTPKPSSPSETSTNTRITDTVSTTPTVSSVFLPITSQSSA